MRDITIKEKDFFVNGVKIAHSYTRVVEGLRGAYVEFHGTSLEEDQIEVAPGQEWRLTNYWKGKAFYGWFQTKTSHKKIYLQYRKVKYADYLEGMWYISVDDVVFEGDLHWEVSDHPLD